MKYKLYDRANLNACSSPPARFLQSLYCFWSSCFLVNVVAAVSFDSVQVVWPVWRSNEASSWICMNICTFLFHPLPCLCKAMISILVLIVFDNSLEPDFSHAIKRHHQQTSHQSSCLMCCISSTPDATSEALNYLFVHVWFVHAGGWKVVATFCAFISFSTMLLFVFISQLAECFSDCCKDCKATCFIIRIYRLLCYRHSSNICFIFPNMGF